jgi:hypothetical protein
MAVLSFDGQTHYERAPLRVGFDRLHQRHSILEALQRPNSVSSRTVLSALTETDALEASSRHLWLA